MMEPERETAEPWRETVWRMAREKGSHMDRRIIDRALKLGAGEAMAVLYGAALHAAFLNKKAQEVELMGVTQGCKASEYLLAIEEIRKES